MDKLERAVVRAAMRKWKFRGSPEWGPIGRRLIGRNVDALINYYLDTACARLAKARLAKRQGKRRGR